MSSPAPQLDGGDDAIIFAHLSERRSAAAVHGVAWATANTLIQVLLNGLVFVVTSRILLPRDFGQVALATAIVTFAGQLGPTAFGEALIQKHVIRRSHTDSVFWLTFAHGLALYAVLIVAVVPLARHFDNAILGELIWILGAKVFLDLIAVVPNALIARAMAFHLLAFRTAVSSVVSGMICLGLVFSGYGLWALALAQLASAAAACAAAFWSAGWAPRLRVRRASLRELARYGVFASGNKMLAAMNIDQMALGFLLGTNALGIYNFAKRIFLILNDLFAGGVNSVSHVMLSSLQNDRQKLRAAFLLASFGCSLISFPVFFGLAAVANDAVPLVFGPHWHEAIWPTRFYVLIGVMAGIGILQGSLISSQGRSDWWFYYLVARNVATTMIVVLLYRFGVSVITAAILLSVVALWPISLKMVASLLGMRLGSYLAQFVRPAFAALAMIAVMSAVATAAQGWPAAARLAAEVAVGAAVYGTIVLLLCRERIVALIAIVTRAARLRRGRADAATPA